jgi:hypothetical protein
MGKRASAKSSKAIEKVYKVFLSFPFALRLFSSHMRLIFRQVRVLFSTTDKALKKIHSPTRAKKPNSFQMWLLAIITFCPVHLLNFPSLS